jgi:lipoate-protein ligase A
MWRIVDSGKNSGLHHMETDRAALAAMESVPSEPTIRFFQWDQPTVTYGYLLELADVEKWSSSFGKAPLVKRPTGGGAVWHTTSELSVSLLWQRRKNLFPENPRACYAEIHSRFQKASQKFFDRPLELFTKSKLCATPSRQFSACFEEPVCNDVMIGKKKIIGGALRVARQAMLYQGAIQVDGGVNLNQLKKELTEAFN